MAHGRGVTATDFDQAGASVREGDIVLIYSAEVPGDAENFILDQTYVTPEGASWLVERGVKAVGVEPFGFDTSMMGFASGTATAPRSRIRGRRTASSYRQASTSSRGLTNLARLAGNRVRFAGLPLPVPQSSGSPIRAIAWEEPTA